VRAARTVAYSCLDTGIKKESRYLEIQLGRARRGVRSTNGAASCLDTLVSLKCRIPKKYLCTRIRLITYSVRVLLRLLATLLCVMLTHTMSRPTSARQVVCCAHISSWRSGRPSVNMENYRLHRSRASWLTTTSVFQTVNPPAICLLSLLSSKNVSSTLLGRLFVSPHRGPTVVCHNICMPVVPSRLNSCEQIKYASACGQTYWCNTRIV
jgi:hypothetical protein